LKETMIDLLCSTMQYCINIYQKIE